MTPQEIQALAQGIVGTFISSIPNIVTQVNQQNKNNRANSSSRSSKESLENDIERETVSRIERERDVTRSLVGLLQARHKELKHLTSFNEQMINLIRQNGTFENESSRVLDRLHKANSRTTTQYEQVFKKMDVVGDRSKLLSSKINSVIADIGNASDPSKVFDNLTYISKTLKDNVQKLFDDALADQTYSSPSDKLKMLGYIATLAQNTSRIPQASSGNDIANLMAPLQNIVYDLESRAADFGPIRKATNIVDSKLSVVNQHLEHLQDFTKIYGDKFGELKGLDDITDSVANLLRQRSIFESQENKTAPAVLKFTQQISNEINNLMPKIDEAMNEVKQNTKKMKWEEIKKLFREGNIGDAKNGLFDMIPLGPFGKLIGPLMKVGKEGALAIGEDQRAVQKYGVNMKSLLTNMDDAVSTGLSPQQIAEWKQQNRTMNASIGGEVSGTAQFHNMMSELSNNNAIKLSLDGKEQSFSTLVGGDSQYQKETYDSMMMSMAKMGIKPNEANFSENFTKDNGIYKTAYKLGLLPKELTDFHTSLTESSSFNVYAMDKNSDELINTVNSFQKLGQTLGLSTSATQALTKQLYDDSHKSGINLVKGGILSEVLAKQMGFSDKDASQINFVNRLQGSQQLKYLTENEDFAKGPYRQYLLKKQEASQNELNYGGSFNDANMTLNAINKTMPELAASEQKMLVILNKSLLTKGIDFTNANNVTENPNAGIAAQEILSKAMPAMENIVTKSIYLAHVLDAVGGDLKDVGWNMFTNSVNEFGIWVKKFTGFDEESKSYDMANVLSSRMLMVQGQTNPTVNDFIKNRGQRTVITPEQQTNIAKELTNSYDQYLKQANIEKQAKLAMINDPTHYDAKERSELQNQVNKIDENSHNLFKQLNVQFINLNLSQERIAKVLEHYKSGGLEIVKPNQRKQ